jgi:Domain of unknown function (DUF4345)
MDTISRIGLWQGRVVLLAATVIFALIGLRYLINPVEAANEFKISLGTATAITNMRVGFGAFPLGFAIIVFSCLISTGRLLRGLFFVGTIIAVTTAVRIYGAVVDGTTHATIKVLRPEIVMSILSGVGIILELRRRRFQ